MERAGILCFFAATGGFCVWIGNQQPHTLIPPAFFLVIAGICFLVDKCRS